ncbi:MAG: hypothetical protein KR126chlam1_00468 [Chlamydiae bacterium]|nr:hypothetical protein [Chlamydiota bacterium]
MKKLLFLLLFFNHVFCISPDHGNANAMSENPKILGYNYFPEELSPYVSASEFKQLTDHTFFCTHPRSGTNLTLEISCYLTRRPHYWNRENSSFWQKVTLHNRCMVDLDYEQFPFFCTHLVHETNQLSRRNQLITTLRNYKEIFFRGSSSFPSQHKMNTYFSYLKLFESWDSENRMMVKYEDLILRPFEVVKEIGDFLQVSEDRVDQLISEYDIFKENILNSYSNSPRTGKSYTRGKSLDFHRQKISPDVLKKVDEVMYRTNPYLFEKYLAHYREVE